MGCPFQLMPKLRYNLHEYVRGSDEGDQKSFSRKELLNNLSARHLSNQNPRKFKDKDNLWGVLKINQIKLFKKSETKGGIVSQGCHFPIFG